MRHKRRRSRQAPQASSPLSPFWGGDSPPSLVRYTYTVPNPLSEAQQRALSEYMTALTSPAARAAAQREGEFLQRCGQAYGRWVEAGLTRAAAEEAAWREAAEREARRRRRRRADNRRRAAQRQAAEREAAEREAAEHKAAEREAAEREAAEREAVEHNVPKQKTQRAPRGEAQRVKMTDEDISWAEKNLSELKKGYCNLEAAVVDFERRWKEDPTRNKRKLPSRTQFIDKVWKKRTATSDSD